MRPSPPPFRRWLHSAGRRGWLPGLLLACALVQLATLGPGVGWGDDAALYVLHARNLAEGRPYQETGYIPNPHRSEVSPRSYPPGYPLLLAPVYGAFGRNMTAFRIEQCLFLLLSVTVVAAFLASELPGPAAMAGTTLFALNPYLATVKNFPESDLPFLLFSTLVFLLALRVDTAFSAPPAGSSARWRWPVLLGVTVYAAIACRTVGAVWLLALVTRDLAGFRRLRLPTITALAVAMALVFLQSVSLGAGEASYVEQFRRDLGYVPANLRAYAVSLAQFWPSGITALDRLLLAVLDGLALFGFASRVRSSFRLPEIFALLYLAALALWPSVQAPRFLIPLVPVYILYVATALVRLGDRSRRVAWLAPALVLVAYATAYARGPLRQFPGAESGPAQEMFAYLRNETPPEAVVVFRKPRALVLYADRRAATYHEAESDADLWTFFDEIDASHLVVNKGAAPDAVGEDDVRYARYIQLFADRHASDLRLLFENDQFRVFALRAAGRAER